MKNWENLKALNSHEDLTTLILSRPNIELTQQVPTNSLGCQMKNSVYFFLKACRAVLSHPGAVGLGGIYLQLPYTHPLGFTVEGQISARECFRGSLALTSLCRVGVWAHGKHTQAPQPSAGTVLSE